MERTEIIKALECCQIRHICKKCDECAYHRWLEPTCRGVLVEDALALINELTAENERLKARVLEENHLRHQAEEMLAQGMSVVKADTVRKMQEALEQRIHSKLSYHGWYLKETIMPSIAKEMLDES